jgi:hypothetical protein
LVTKALTNYDILGLASNVWQVWRPVASAVANAFFFVHDWIQQIHVLMSTTNGLILLCGRADIHAAFNQSGHGQGRTDSTETSLVPWPPLQRTEEGGKGGRMKKREANEEVMKIKKKTERGKKGKKRRINYNQQRRKEWNEKQDDSVNETKMLDIDITPKHSK